MNDARRKVIIVDDCRVTCYCLASALGDRGIATSMAWDVPSFLSILDGATSVTVLLNNATSDSATLLGLSLDLDPKVKVIVFNLADDEESRIVSCVEREVAALLLKSESLEELIELIHAVENGRILCSAKVSTILLRRVYSVAGRADLITGPDLLTNRERAVLELLEQGLTNQQIATRLGLTLHTVKNHVHSLLTKLGVTSRQKAATVSRLSRFSRSGKHAGGVEAFRAAPSGRGAAQQ